MYNFHRCDSTVEDESTTSSSNQGIDDNTDQPNRKKKSRKRKRTEENWRRNVRRRSRQLGEEYVNVKGRIVPGKALDISKNCKNKCKFQCARLITADQQQEILTEFWQLSDVEKWHYFSRTTTKSTKARHTTEQEVARRFFSFTYNFDIDGRGIRVCKKFYLNTLCISQQRINYFYAAKCNLTGTTQPDKRGVIPSRSVEDTEKQRIKDHIASFPTIPSHYCRKDTDRNFLSSDLTMKRMYELYTEDCEIKGVTPQKLWLYRNIFNHDFNLSFFVPKKDQCSKCVIFNNTNNAMTGEQKQKYEKHVIEKLAV